MRQRVTRGRVGETKMARPLMPRLAGAKLLLVSHYCDRGTLPNRLRRFQFNCLMQGI